MAEKGYLPDISVIVTCINKGRWVERCIRSISHQREIGDHMLEVLVVDQDNDDHTREALENMAIIGNVRIFSDYSGAAHLYTMEKIVRSTLGRYIMLVDANDYLSRNCLNVMKIFLDMNRFHQAVAVDYLLVDIQENILERHSILDRDMMAGIMFRKESLLDGLETNSKMLVAEVHHLRRHFEALYPIGHLEFPFYKRQTPGPTAAHRS
ncbi:MAG: glycosyltransferase family 2 protein [Magnetococcales bacterium]|nr:glycosyltransferase family 2 protein [Magnetococcales bacterium]HIJ85655.1 glycosyltransferase family 2 protein [Magnetococcales bacterium]